MQRLDNNCLNQLWSKWYTKNGPTQGYIPNYDYMDRKNVWTSRFEDFLFSNGAYVIQIDGIKYLEFFEEKDITLFLLKWM